MNNLKDIWNQSNQPIDKNKYKHPNGTLSTTFHKPAGEVNLYVRFGYERHKIWKHTWGQVSGSMNAEIVNVNKQVNNQKLKDEN